MLSGYQARVVNLVTISLCSFYWRPRSLHYGLRVDEELQGQPHIVGTSFLSSFISTHHPPGHYERLSLLPVFSAVVERPYLGIFMHFPMKRYNNTGPGNSRETYRIFAATNPIL